MPIETTAITDHLEDLATHTQESPPHCDNRSVGMLVFNDLGEMLLIERKRFPPGFAPPAGHVDGDTFRGAAIRELQEEVGLTVNDLAEIARGKKQNPCRRPSGGFHNWRIYHATVEGRVSGNTDETKQVRWVGREEVESLAKRTESYLNGEISPDDFNQQPGLEPVWYEWFQNLGILPDPNKSQRGIIPPYLYRTGALIAGRYYGGEFSSVKSAARAFHDLGLTVYPSPEPTITQIDGGNDTFMFIGSQQDVEDPYQIEFGYLRALKALQDLPMSQQVFYVAVHDGYLGRSASIETVYAMTLGKRIVFSELPKRFSKELSVKIRQIIETHMEKYPVIPIEQIKERYIKEVAGKVIPKPNLSTMEQEDVILAIHTLERDLKKTFSGNKKNGSEDQNNQSTV